ncbi:MAG: histidine phosphatase family protein [Pseudomonadota bacterium]
MTKLALLRHGHTAWNREGRLQGRTDIPLDEEARAQLSPQRLPGDWQSADLISSPLLRAKETAELVTARAPKTEPALIEMNWGDWEGAYGRELRADPDSGYRDIEEWGWSMRPPSGESLQEVRDRVEPWALSLDNPTVAVCHIGIMRVLLGCATDWDFFGAPPFAVKRNRLFVLTISDGVLRWDGEIERLVSD